MGPARGTHLTSSSRAARLLKSHRSFAWPAPFRLRLQQVHACAGGEDRSTDGKGYFDDPGAIGMALFGVFLAVFFPLLQPRVPNFYHKTEELIAEVRGLQGQHGGVEVKVEKVEDPLGPLQASRPALTLATLGVPGSTPRFRMLVVANEHARELITGEVALHVMQTAVGEKTDSQAGSRLRNLLQRGLEISVLPVANPEGRNLAEAMRPCQRGTADIPFLSIDLNRNFPVDWLPGAQLNYLNSSFDVHGTAPFSSYQARVIREVALRQTWDVFVDLHSGALALNAPFGHRWGGSSDLQEQLRAVEEAKRFCPECKSGPLRDVMRYDNPGMLLDWMYQERGTKYAYLWEVFSGKGLCAAHYNPVEQSSFDEVLDRWTLMLATLGEYLFDSSTE
eukprot:TRINITY_DN29106_c0_g1_i1.p1 TRINITY_DN29106_c0_g1~~TRINITY_DN29106_c0_g1_i1.p1  ORF type:complete len:404 (-),score=79.28 TRINITY_DN29106_c0_g1_i1:266-1441(-)